MIWRAAENKLICSHRCHGHSFCCRLTFQMGWDIRLNEMSACFSVSDETCARAYPLTKMLAAFSFIRFIIVRQNNRDEKANRATISEYPVSVQLCWNTFTVQRCSGELGSSDEGLKDVVRGIRMTSTVPCWGDGLGNSRYAGYFDFGVACWDQWVVRKKAEHRSQGHSICSFCA